jgi:hypothetical protein
MERSFFRDGLCEFGSPEDPNSADISAYRIGTLHSAFPSKLKQMAASDAKEHSGLCG